MTNEEKELWTAIDQINGLIEKARTRYYDLRLCEEPAFDSIYGRTFGGALIELDRQAALARLALREIVKK